MPGTYPSQGQHIHQPVWGSVSPPYLGELLVVQSKLQGPPLLVVLLVRAELLLLFFELPETFLNKGKRCLWFGNEGSERLTCRIHSRRKST